VLLALVLSVARMKFVGSDDHFVPTTPHESQIQNSFPFFQSIDEVHEINRAEESESCSQDKHKRLAVPVISVGKFDVG